MIFVQSKLNPIADKELNYFPEKNQRFDFFSSCAITITPWSKEREGGGLRTIIFNLREEIAFRFIFYEEFERIRTFKEQCAKHVATILLENDKKVMWEVFGSNHKILGGQQSKWGNENQLKKKMSPNEQTKFK